MTESSAASVRGALVGLALCMLLSSLGTSIANVGLPTLAHELTASFQEVQWIVLAYLLAITTVIVTVGRLGDVIGRRRLLLVGIVVFTSASVVCGIAPTLEVLIAGRAAQGLGAAMMMALTIAMVGASVPRARTGRAMGMLGTMSAIGTTLGPSLGGILISAAGWRAIFFVKVPLGVLAAVFAYRYLPVDRPAATTERFRFDGRGTVLLAVTLAAYALAMTIGRGHLGTTNIVLLATAIIGAGLFMVVERTAVAPLIPLAMFRSAPLSARLVMSVLVSTVMRHQVDLAASLGLLGGVGVEQPQAGPARDQRPGDVLAIDADDSSGADAMLLEQALRGPPTARARGGIDPRQLGERLPVQRISHRHQARRCREVRGEPGHLEGGERGIGLAGLVVEPGVEAAVTDAGEDLRRRAVLEIDLDIRPALRQAGQQPADRVAVRVAACAKPELSSEPSLDPGCLVHQVLMGSERSFCLGEESFSVAGQAHPARRALEQRHSERVLEGLDVRADRGLAQMQELRRPRDAAFASNRDERLELIEVHRPSNVPVVP